MAGTNEQRRAKRAELVADLCAIVGLVMLSVGAWQVYEPAGLIVPGAVLLVIGVGGALRGGR